MLTLTFSFLPFQKTLKTHTQIYLQNTNPILLKLSSEGLPPNCFQVRETNNMVISEIAATENFDLLAVKESRSQ
jgi:hypothetical protein